MKQHGEAGSSDVGTVEWERKRIQELIKKYGYIFNMDETGLFYGYLPISLFLTSNLTPIIEWHQTEACQTVNNQELRARRSG
jgi:hypothetical protein